jgi:hypothetical protein
MWGDLSNERTGLSFKIAVDPCQLSHSRVRVPRDSWQYFTDSDSRLLQPGEAGHCIYIPQEHGCPVIHPDTGYPFRRLLLLADTAEVFQPVSTRGHKHQHKTGYTHQAQHKPSERAETSIDNVKINPRIWGLALMFMHCFAVIVVKTGVMPDSESLRKRQIHCMTSILCSNAVTPLRPNLLYYNSSWRSNGFQ